MSRLQHSAQMSLCRIVPGFLRPLCVIAPFSTVTLVRHPQRLHCHKPSGFGRRLIRSIRRSFSAGSDLGTRYSVIRQLYAGLPECLGVLAAQFVYRQRPALVVDKAINAHAFPEQLAATDPKDFILPRC